MKLTAVLYSTKSMILTIFWLLLIIVVAVPSYGKNERSWGRFNGWELTEYYLDGLPENIQGGLLSGLALSGQWKLLKGTVRPLFSGQELAHDLARISLFLAREGYPSAQVAPILTASNDSKQLAIRIEIIPGAPVRVAGLTLHGWPDGLAFPDTNNARILHKGDVFKDQKINSSVEGLKNILANSGYAHCEVSCDVKIVSVQLVQLVFVVEAGGFFHLDEIVAAGCSEDLKPLALRIMNIKPGTAYSQAGLNQASLDLRTTQLFGQVILETEPLRPGSLSLTAQLKNARMRHWTAAVGSWSDNPWLVRAGWLNRNFFSKGRALDFKGTFASHEQNAGVGVTWLGILSPRARTRISFEYLREDEDAYLSNELRTEFVQSFRPSDKNIWNVGMGVSHVNVDDLAAEEDMPESQSLLLELWTDRKWDWTDSPLYPTRGGYLKSSLTYTPSFLFSESPYASIQLDAVSYNQLMRKMVVAGRCRLGLAEPLGDTTDIIPNRRFHVGGYNTHRGYSRRDLGPRDSEGNSRGGQAVLLAGVELRIPLIWIFDVAVFVDSGQLWQEISEFNLRDMNFALGMDLDVRTPLGPLRVGYAWNQSALENGQSEGMWHGGIGYPW